MTDMDMPLPEPDNRLALEVHRLMHHYLIDNGDEIYRTMRAYVAAEVAKERERAAKAAEDFLTRGRSPLGRSVAAAIRAG
jgi:hypothetical protein